MQAVRVHAATDVTAMVARTLHTMLRASGKVATLERRGIPFVADVLDLAARGCVPGGTKRTPLRRPARRLGHAAGDGASGARRRNDVGWAPGGAPLAS